VPNSREQFLSEIKTDLNLERLPCGKFCTNNLILHLAKLAYRQIISLPFYPLPAERN